MLKRIKAYVEKWEMLNKEDCVIVGVSGGADSVCLLLVLIDLQKELGFRLVAVHVNHGLRGADADADALYVEKLCEKHQVLLKTYHIDVELIAKKRKQSTEEAGREVRRACFEEVAKKYGGTKIALAHHQNDNAETLLLNLARGTGLKGLGGIAPVNGKYIRPLLSTSRTEIEEYLRSCNVSYCIDVTNQSDLYTRNKIRIHVLPYLEREINEKTMAHMNETMEYLRSVQEYMTEQACVVERTCVREISNGLLLCSELEQIPSALRTLIVHRTLARVSGSEKDLASVHVNEILELFQKQSGRRLHLPYGMEAVRTYEGVEISRNLSEETLDSMEEIEWVKQAGTWSGRWEETRITCKVYKKEEIPAGVSEKKYTKWFDYDIIKGNLCFRTRKTGDYIQIHAEGNTQKLKSYFINEKIPQKQRDQILLVTEGNQVLWIPGYRKSAGYSVTEHTKTILEISVNEGESYGREN